MRRGFASQPVELHREIRPSTTTTASGIPFFLTRDPIRYGDGPNMYCYVHCNPITSFDPLGLQKEEIQSYEELQAQKQMMYDYYHKDLISGEYNTSFGMTQYLMDVMNENTRRESNTIEPNYLEKSLDQVWKGNYSENVTLLGTGGQVITGLAGVDLPGDIRDLTYDIQHWEPTWGHFGQTLLDGVALFPLIGVVKYADEVGLLAKNAPTKPIWSSTKSKSSVENAFEHWKNHGAEFPEFQNSKQYVEGAKNFMNNPPGGTLFKTRANGDQLFYNPESNIFGVQNVDGAPRTLFRPDAGLEYWERQ